MCGLFGWFEKKPGQLTGGQKKKLTHILGRKSESRGLDSWGVMCRWEGEQHPWYKVHKQAVAYTKRTKRTRFNKDLMKSDFIIGHTRFGTHGSVRLANAHPFNQGGLIMAHNGVISGHANYSKETTLKPRGETDSETFLAWLVSKGKGVRDFLDVDSSFDAFNVYDTIEDKLYLVTKGRSLHYIEDEKVIIWSSASTITEMAYSTVFNTKYSKTWSEEMKDDEIRLVTSYGLKVIERRRRPIGYKTSRTWGYNRQSPAALATQNQSDTCPASYGKNSWPDYEDDFQNFPDVIRPEDEPLDKIGDDDPSESTVNKAIQEISDRQEDGEVFDSIDMAACVQEGCSYINIGGKMVRLREGAK